MGPESCFPLVSFPDADQVVGISDTDFGDDLGSRNERSVFHGSGVLGNGP